MSDNPSPLDFAGAIQAKLDAFRSEVALAGPLPNAVQVGPALRSPTGDPADGIEVPESVDPEGNLSPWLPPELPNFKALSESRKIGMLDYLYAALQRDERLLAPNVAGYNAIILEPIVDRATALLAVSSYTPSLFYNLLLTLNQVNELLVALGARVMRYGVTPPNSWLGALADPTNVENIAQPDDVGSDPGLEPTLTD